MATDLTRAAEPLTRVPLRVGEKHVLFATLIRREPAFLPARVSLDDDKIAANDAAYRVVWECVCSYYDETARLPQRHTLQNLLSRRAAESPELLDERQAKTVRDFLAFAFSVTEEQLNLSDAASLLSKYLEDRIADGLRVRLSSYTPVDFRELLQQATTNVEMATAMAAEQLDEPFPEGWHTAEDAVIEMRDTGVEFLNRMFSNPEVDAPGGHGCTEIFGFLAPFGAGKTTISTRLTVKSAEIAYMNWRAAQEAGEEFPFRVSYHFTWEEPLTTLRIRALSVLAEVPKARLVRALTARDLYGNLSTSDNLQEYEQRRWASVLRLGAAVPGESERVQRATRILNTTWRVIDFTAQTEGSGGAGGVPEVAARIRSHQQQLAREHDGPVGVQMALADYAGEAVTRQINAKGLDMTAYMRVFLKQWPGQMKSQVAVPFNCPCWVIHQLNTEANSLAPGVVPKYTAAAEARSFAENLDFCVMLGTKDTNSRMVCVCNKARREAPQPAIVVRLAGAMQDIVDESRDYRLHAHQIVSRAESESVQGVASPLAAPPDPTGGVDTIIDANRGTPTPEPQTPPAPTMRRRVRRAPALPQ